MSAKWGEVHWDQVTRFINDVMLKVYDFDGVLEVNW
jgi:hypothetical protein